MDEKSSFGTFKLCWDVILQESAKFENKFFNALHCKISDSRDTNFDIVENRLAYIYKYGYFNILIFEKCFLLFLNQCSKELFPFENLNVCSFSNGPGFDIIGLLSALRVSNKPLKCLPVFNAINVHETWSELYKSLVCKAYETCITNSFLEYYYLNPTNIDLIKGDIYSTLSSEAINYISNSNVLLMVNVFASSKATPTTFESTLKEIFILLQPGSLIFFIGSKNNLKHFSKLTHLKKYVKSVFGPLKVTLDSLPIDDQISNIIGVKPCDSGHAQFIVWQKKQKALEEDIIECKDDSDDTISEPCLSSESSLPSFIEKSDESKNGIKSKNSLITPQSMSQNYNINSVESITANLSDIKSKHLNCKEQKLEVQQKNSLPSSCSNVSNLMIDTPKKIDRIFQENKTSLIRDNQILAKASVNLKHVEADSASSLVGNSNSQINQTMNDKSILTPKEKKIQSLNKMENQSLDKKTKKDNCENTKISFQEYTSLHNFHKNSVKIENEITPQAANTEKLNHTNNNVQSLLQRCESLISKLEELTNDIKNEFNQSRNNSVSNKTHFCNRQRENCEVFHHCCVKLVHSCCCRQFCKC